MDTIYGDLLAIDELKENKTKTRNMTLLKKNCIKIKRHSILLFKLINFTILISIWFFGILTFLFVFCLRQMIE